MPRQPLEDKPGQKPYGQRSSERRRQQNREAQRLLRERRLIQDAEQAAKLARQEEEINGLRALVHELRAENSRLRNGDHSYVATSGGPSAPPSFASTNSRHSHSPHEEAVMRSAGFSEMPSRSGSPALTNALSSFQSPPMQVSTTGSSSNTHIPPSLPPLQSLPPPMPNQNSYQNHSQASLFPPPGIPTSLSPANNSSMHQMNGQLDIVNMASSNRMMFLADAVAQTLVNRIDGGPSSPRSDDRYETHSNGSAHSHHAEQQPRPAFHISASGPPSNPNAMSTSSSGWRRGQQSQHQQGYPPGSSMPQGMGPTGLWNATGNFSWANGSGQMVGGQN